MEVQSRPLTVGDAVIVASRLASLLFFWLFIDVLLMFPERVYALMHYADDFSLVSGPGYLRTHYVLVLMFAIARAGLWLILAIVFYGCGPRVREFFYPRETDAT